MVLVNVDNSECLIEGLSVQDHRKLKESLSYTIEGGYFAGKPRYIKKSLLDRSGRFPTGLLNQVLFFLDTNRIYYSTNALKSPPQPQQGRFSPCLDIQPYSFQLEAINACKREIRGGTISMPTGTGKSITIALLIAAFQLRTLIVVPTLGLKAQLIVTLQGVFGDISDITVENIDSSVLKTATDYDLLIIDECHHAAAKTYRELNKKVWNSIYYRFCFTATPFRSKNEEQILYESIAGDVIYKLSYKQAVAAKAIVPVEAYYVEIPTIRTNGRTWAAVYSDLVVKNHVRNELIANIINKLKDSQKSTLCLINEIAHGKALQQLCKAHFANGTDSDSDLLIWAFNEKKLTALLGTTGIIGEGIDTKPAEFVIIAGLGKSKNRFMQNVGRGVRKYPGKETCKVILFLDKSHKWSLAHYKAQVKILKDEYGVIPAKLELT